jgi:hypothetical protein
MLEDEILAVVVCDDIRKEITNKDILIGVYAADIVVSFFPAAIALAFWIEMNPKKIGHRELSFRLVSQGNPIEFTVGMEISITESLGLPLPALPAFMQSPGEIRLEVKDGKEWRLLKSKKVKLGLVGGPFGTPPSAGS